MGQDQHCRNEEQPLPGRRQQRRLPHLVDGLGQHAGDDDDPAQREHRALTAQSPGPKGDNLRVVAEHRHDLGREDHPQHRCRRQKHRGPLDAKAEGVLHPAIQPRAVVEAAHRLKSLAEADQRRLGQLHGTGHHAHGGNGRVAVQARAAVEADGGDAGQPLAAQGRHAALADLHQQVPADAHVPQADAQVAAPGAAQKQHAERRQLAENGGQGRPGHAHIQYEDQQRIQPHVQHRSGSDAHHAVGGAALKAQLVIQHEGCRHIRGPQQDDPQIAAGIGQDGIRGAQQPGQGREKDLAQRQNDAPRQKRQGHAGGGHFPGVAGFMAAQLAGDVVAGPVAKEKAHRLDHRHQGEHHPHRAGGAVAVELAHEIGIHHVIAGRHHHADDGGRRHFAHQMAHRLAGELLKFCFLLVVHVIPLRS